LTSWRIDPLELFTLDNNLTLVTNVFSCIYISFVVIILIYQVHLMFQLRKKYVFQFWNWVDLGIILFSICAGGIYIYRLYKSYDVLEFFRKTKGYGYYKMQYIAYWNESLRYCLAFCIGFSTLKFLKFLSFNKIIGFLTLTIRTCAKDLLAFSFIFLILFLAFTQLNYLTFDDKTIKFSTISRSLASCFLTMLGTFDAIEMLESDAIFGALLFIFFFVFIVFIMLNVLVTIISETFSYIRFEDKKKKNEFEMSRFLRDQLEIFKKAQNEDELGHELRYVDCVSYFPHKIDQLLECITLIYTGQNAFIDEQIAIKQKMEKTLK
jgi:hypothetical protein